MKLLGRTAVAVAVLAACYAVIVGINVRSWLFQPAVYPRGDWQIQRDYGARDVRMTAADGSTLSGWWIPYAGARRTVLFFHSRRGNISEQAAHIVKLQELESNIFLIDYRGYGKSGGRPSLAGLRQDGETAYQYVTGTLHVPPRELILHGEEIGAAVAAALAAAHPQVAGLVLESPFPNLRAFADHAMPLSGWLLGGAGGYDVTAWVRQYPGPKLFLFGSNDEDVPAAMSERVFDAAAPPKSEHEIMGGAAASLVIYGGDQYRDWLREFYSDARLPVPEERLPKLPMLQFGRR